MSSGMSYVVALAGIGTVHLLAAMSPGPAFVVVTRVSVGESRKAALGAAFGVATAALIWAIAATLGMHLLLARAAWLYDVLKLMGGAYLVWLGFQAWRHADEPAAPAAPAGRWASGRRGDWGSSPTSPIPRSWSSSAASSSPCSRPTRRIGSALQPSSSSLRMRACGTRSSHCSSPRARRSRPIAAPSVGSTARPAPS